MEMHVFIIIFFVQREFRKDLLDYTKSKNLDKMNKYNLFVVQNHMMDIQQQKNILNNLVKI